MQVLSCPCLSAGEVSGAKCSFIPTESTSEDTPFCNTDNPNARFKIISHKCEIKDLISNIFLSHVLGSWTTSSQLEKEKYR